MNITTNNIDETTNHDLPGEIHEWTEDPADQQWHVARRAQRALESITLPCEIEDLTDENCGIEIIDDPYGDEEDIEFKEDCDRLFQQTQDFGDAPDFDEDWRDPEVWDDEDDSWSDSDSLASCGWGEDEAYGCFE